MDHGNLARREAIDEAALARAAMNGCVASFGLLFERLRPRLYAAAVTQLGYCSDADDAVHDTFIQGITRLAQLREAEAFGAWLYAILRNTCLMQHRYRRRRASDAETERHFRELPDEERIETAIEKRELRDWIWSGLQHLPETQRAAVLLRYFGSNYHYEEIGSALGIPVGTVRSRLHDAKLRLCEILLSAAGRDDREARRQAERRTFYEEAFRGLYNGRRDEFLSHYADDLDLQWSTGARARGRMHFDTEMDSDLQTGVRFRPLRIMASGNLTVMEGALLNPPEKPDLCPPGCVVVMREGVAQVERMHIHLADRAPTPEA